MQLVNVVKPVTYVFTKYVEYLVNGNILKCICECEVTDNDDDDDYDITFSDIKNITINGYPIPFHKMDSIYESYLDSQFKYMFPLDQIFEYITKYNSR